MMSIRYLLGLVLFVAFLGCTLTAQTPVCETACKVSVGQPFVAFTEADPAVGNYVLLVNGQPSGIAPRFANGFVEFAHPGFSSPATLTLVVRATANGVTFDYTDPFPLSVSRRKIKIR